MRALIWLRRLVILLLASGLLLLLFAVLVIVDGMVRAALVGGFGGGFLPICLWLDRNITGHLQRRILLTTLAASGEQLPQQQRAAGASGD